MLRKYKHINVGPWWLGFSWTRYRKAGGYSMELRAWPAVLSVEVGNYTPDVWVQRLPFGGWVVGASYGRLAVDLGMPV